MSERILVDNDVIIKIALWCLGDAMLGCTTLDGTPPAILGVARYVVAGRLAKALRLADRVAASAAFEAMQTAMTIIEPNDEEIADAADFEATASALGLDLDPGESQLLAILGRRGCDALLTGDKRAICAIEQIAPKEAAGRIACLEQLMADVVRRSETSAIRARVCAEPAADRAITVCFACSSINTPTEVDVKAGLTSYTEDLRRRASTVLLIGADLSALAT
jgi:hypothetical protein